MLVLRDYQERAEDSLRDSYRKGNKAPLLVLPTGGGKTVIFCDIAAKTASKGKRVYILVHRIELLRQTSRALYKSEVKHGLINPGFTGNYRENVQVASVQTLVRRMEKQPLNADLIIVDEAHHATAGTWRKIIEANPQARVLGVTATPIRGDGCGLGIEAGGIFDDLVIGSSVPELIAAGHLVKPVIYAPSEKLDLSSVKITRGDYDKTDLFAVMDKPKIIGSAVAHYAKLCPGTPAVVFCVSIQHAQHVADEFAAAGFRAAAVDGKMSEDDRKSVLDGLGNGALQVVTSCDLISEGTDIPAIGCAILLRPTKSTGLYLQQVGRALRPCSGKDRAVVLDHVSNVFTHGLPDELRDWSLLGTKKKKKKKGDAPDFKVMQCDKCFAVHEPAPACPICGHVFAVKKKVGKDSPDLEDGELREITKADAEIIQKQRRREIARAETLEDLKAIEQARGYKAGWAAHVYKSREKRELKI